ncbi:MAG TPA: outer membrane protein transport protein, partial [Candidatus Saccharimonadales bacterium]|nr:outer membrane protein transport protein [Candidatus Saccharimonadales bacterium]
IYYNPAGIAQLEGDNLRLGMYGIYLDPSYKNPMSGQTFDNENKLHAVPEFYYTYGKEDWPVSFGLGVYAPFGLGLEWAQNTGFRNVTGAIESSLTYMTFNPVVAIKLAPNLSIGGGVSANYAYAHLKQGLSSTPNNDDFEFKGDGWAVGYNLGALWQPIEELSFGATFRSSTVVNLQGHTLSEFNGVQPSTESLANTDFTFPLVAVFGVSYRPTPKWNLEFDADYADWSSLGTLTIHQNTPPPILPLSDVPVTLDWESSWYFEWGATRYFDNGWHVSAGYIFNENSVPDANYTPAVADVDKHFFSIGIGRTGKKLDFDIAYQFGYGPTRNVSDATGSSLPARGDYTFISHAVSASIGWHF